MDHSESREGRRMAMDSRYGYLFVGSLLLGGCAADAPQVEEAGEAVEVAAVTTGPASVAIIHPANGSEVAGPDIHVVLEVSGLTVAPAGTMEPGTGHHHIFFNTELTPLDQPIPMEVPGIVHLGQAQTEYHFEGVEPGEYRIIAVVADGAHIPLDPPVVDTIVFTVTVP